MNNSMPTPFKITPAHLKLLERLSNADGVSGNEDNIRAIVRKEMKPYCDEIKVDAMGNLLALKRSKAANPVKVLAAAHMDEVGFMIVDEDTDGLFSFEVVGGIDERQLLSKTVTIGKEKIPGIIGSKPIHLMEEQRDAQHRHQSAMRIDVGPANSSKVKVGDYAAFATRFHQAGGTIFGKALDDRLGVASLIELLKHVPENVEFLAAFTVQEELGLRGARVAAYCIPAGFCIRARFNPCH